jgi:hypothetical protein
MAERAFRHVTPEEFRWRTELSRGLDSLCELVWIDGHLDDGWQIGIGLLRARPLMDGHPAILIRLLSPEGDFFPGGREVRLRRLPERRRAVGLVGG